MAADEWISTAERLPTEDELVQTLPWSWRPIAGAGLQTADGGEPMRRRGSLWFLVDGQQYGLWAPPYWRPIAHQAAPPADAHQVKP
jgi:hypothetical protein